MSKGRLPDGLWLRGETYYACVQVAGKRVRRKLSNSLAEAKRLLAGIRADLHESPAEIVPGHCDWDRLCGDYLADAAQRVRQVGPYRRDLRHFAEFYRVVNTREITPELVNGFREWRRTNRRAQYGSRAVSDRTINKEVATVQAILNWGVRTGRLMRNPLLSLKPLPETRKCKVRRTLKADELTRLFADAPPHLGDILRFIAWTGCRENEAFSVTWDWIDYDRREVRIPPEIAKSGKSRTIPLVEPLVEMLKRRQAEVHARQPHSRTSLAARFTRDIVFVTSSSTKWCGSSSFLQAFYKLASAVGIPGAHRNGSVDIHSLRVTFATLALDGGADLKAVQEVLGHSDPAFTLRVYDRVTDASRRGAVSAVANVTIMSQAAADTERKAQ